MTRPKTDEEAAWCRAAGSSSATRRESRGRATMRGGGGRGRRAVSGCRREVGSSRGGRARHPPHLPASLSHRVGESPAAVGVVGELVQRCRGRGEQHRRPRPRDGRGQLAPPSGITSPVSSASTSNSGHARARVARTPRRPRSRSTPITIAARRRSTWRRDERVDVDALEQPADDPDHRPNARAATTSAACGLVAFESSTQRTPSATATSLDAVRVEAEVARARRGSPRAAPRASRASAARREDVRDDVRRGEAGGSSSSTVVELERGWCGGRRGRRGRRGCRRRRRSRSGPGTPRPKPIARAPSIDLGVLDHVAGRLVGVVVDAGDAGVRRTPWPSRRGTPRASRASRGGRRRG